MRINIWRKKLHIKQHLNIYQQLFADINGFKLSRKARASQDAMEYLYGEIDFVSFIALLSCTNPTKNTVFYDLGSGIGTAVLACTMVFDVKKSCGIELFSSLHQAALKQKEALEQIPEYSTAANKIHFIHGDFLKTNFYDATLIFINSTAFIGDTWSALCQRLNKMPAGTIIITTSKKLPSQDFHVIRATTVKMSWGLVTAYIQERLMQIKNKNPLHAVDNIE
ncbi:hypothetical protein [Legionella oakridgensis]|uniref:Histone-lysine N-methyltransferase, H3 lysine-79 specific n=1 Tax=Legionella oakridgensis TaxID=29423 RepID=A0A0W0X0X2_9GAMM|nr:hypothetical protein [Legionella oakridgensis]ETO94469.1 histone methylation protein DOT1 [Legionella oakridgensis RV-2-2007]KTD38219.1 histone methylation protein DOT1 [Legionella oakridgensis]STY15651.1 putative methyltransferases [Legionella longbeachae]